MRVRADLSEVTRRVVLPIQRYIHAEEAAGFMLMLGAAVALAWANSRWGSQYLRLCDFELTILRVTKSLLHWVNDGLMTFFFLLVGLEIKREIVHGSLSTWRRGSLPVVAALGGMAVPALIYWGFNPAGHGARGWGIPVATDIAFALGVLAMLGPRVPASLKTFLLAFATVDDIGGILIIAVFYTEKLSLSALFAAAAIVVAIALLWRLRWMGAGTYWVMGVLLWAVVLRSGVHATISGVILGLMVPARTFYGRMNYVDEAREVLAKLGRAEQGGRQDECTALLGQVEELTKHTEEPLERLERPLRPWVSYVVLPVFALLNCGVVLSAARLREALTNPVGRGIVVGLLVGKTVGVLAATWLAVRSRLTMLPAGVTWTHVAGASVVAGIGFTVSLFIAELAFDDEASVALAKTAILIASVAAAVGGYLFLLVRSPRIQSPE
jgi:NhaA family Na+:H+ antiporter